MKGSTDLEVRKSPAESSSRKAYVPTMADVAALAGVSTATVSRVIHGSIKVRPVTRAKVQEAVRQLGYMPHPVAQQLASGKTQVIGVIVNTVENPVSAAVIQGVEDALSQNGYRLLLGNSYYRADLEEKLIRTYTSLCTAGIISVGTWLDGHFFSRWPSNHVPIVFINPEGKHPSPSAFPTIRTDGLLGGQLAGRHLIELGHRRIGFIGRKPVGELQRLRFEGLKKALEEAGLKLDPALVVDGGPGPRAGNEGIERLLAQGKVPTAVFCYHDLTAFGVMEALNEAGLSVPEDVSVVGFDDIFVSRYLHLTTLAQPFVRMGRLAAQILLEGLSGEMRLADIVVLPELIVRGSTGPCHTDE